MGWVPVCALCSPTCWSKATMLGCGDSPARLTHIMLQKRCPHSRSVSWSRWMLDGSFTDPTSFAHPLPRPRFHSLFCVSSPALHWLQSRKYFALNCALKFSLSLWKQPFKPTSSNQPPGFSQSRGSLCFLVNCPIITLLSHGNEA